MKTFRNLSIQNKIIFTGIIIIIIFLTVIFGYLFPNMKDNMIEMKRIQLKETIRASHSIVTHYYQQYKEGILTEEAAKLQAADTLRSLRYGPQMKDYIWVNDFNPTMIVHPYSPQLEGKDLSTLKDPDGKFFVNEMVKLCKEYGEGYYDYKWQKNDDKNVIATKISYVMSFKPWNWMLGTGLYIQDAQNEIEIQQGIMQKRMLIIFIAAGILSVLFLYIISKSISNPIKKITEFSRKLAEGELNNRLEITTKDEVGVVSHALNTALEQIERLIIEIQNSVSGINIGINQIADGNNNLSEQVSSQAAALEEIVATIEEFNSSVIQNDENAETAHKLSIESSNIAKKGGNQVKEAIESINLVNKSSEKIQQIVSLINDIAFQINLLSLNAAIEAARAGKYGRGFTVVASEVRNLAQRSGKAAKDIEELINHTIEKINQGSELANSSSKSLSEIIISTETVLDVVSQLSSSFKEQKTGMEQITTTLSDIDAMTQENASLVEETAAASKNMTFNTGDLQKMVGFFKVRKA